MEDKPRTCGNCRWYGYPVNPRTGRKLPAQEGRCHWLIQVRVDQLPMAYRKAIPIMPTTTITARTSAHDCPRWNDVFVVPFRLHDTVIAWAKRQVKLENEFYATHGRTVEGGLADAIVDLAKEYAPFALGVNE